MRKLLTLLPLATLVLALTTPAVAQNPHYVVGPNCTENPLSVTCTGSIAGLGNQNIDVVVSATGVAQIECRNPAGNVAPGQATTINASGTQTNIEVKNGRATFNVTTAEVPAPSGAEVCPNPKWTARITSIDFSSVTITVFQPSGSTNIVLQTTQSI